MTWANTWASTWRRAGVALGVMAGAAVLGAPHPTKAQSLLVQPVRALIAGLDFPEARAMLDAAAVVSPDDPGLALERARLAIYELDCDGAAVILARPDVQKLDRDSALGDIARGCQRVTAALTGARDAARGIDVLWQDEHDAPLAPKLFDTIAQAREALTRDLGVDWPRPTRVVVVRDLLSLSAMTGLPYESARTTGTVAVAKWGRITLLSPRANRHAFPWEDTLAHELTHLAVTRATRDLAPLWLQEGVAKNEETMWRDRGPFDGRPPPESVVVGGMPRHLVLPLDRLGPSIAMLPSADAATVAFAEVTSFVRFYVDTAGQPALVALFDQLKSGREVNAALRAASGSDLSGWDARWRAHLTEPAPRAAPISADSEKPGRDSPRELRDRSRLARLLLARGHVGGALRELDRLTSSGASLTDPGERWLRGRALEAAGRVKEAEALVADPRQVSVSFGPWWALRGRLARDRGDESSAQGSFLEGLAVDPLLPEAACETTQDADEPLDPAKRALCRAARARGEPPFDAD